MASDRKPAACRMPFSGMLLFIFAFLVCNGAGGFAGRLAGSLAFAASALGGAFLEGIAVNGYNMFHFNSPC